MAGLVLGCFLIVGEIAALRKRMPVIGAHLRLMRQSGKKLRRLIAICGIVAFFLIQPVMVAALVVRALSNLNSHFAANLMQELKPDPGQGKLFPIFPAGIR